MDIRQILGRNLKQHRQAMGLSQEQFGLKYDIDRTYVSGIERGVRNPTIQLVERLAEMIGVEPWELLKP